MAQRQGLAIERSRRRDPRALGYGTYRIVNPESHKPVASSEYGYGLTLDDVEEYLS